MNKIDIIVAHLQEQKGDVILNWATNSFMQGPKTYYSLMKASGYQPFDAINTFKANISNGDFVQGDTLSTIPGLLKFNLMVHVIIPESTDYNLTWRNIIATVKTYKRENLCRNLYITIPDWGDVIDNISHFFDYENLLKDFNYIFIVEDETEKKHLDGIISSFKEYDSKQKNTFLNKIDCFFKKITIKISFLLPTSLLSISNGHFKKKLQKNT